jgi:lysophospholipase L1-like esterase
VDDVMAKGAIPIICSPIPRNNWKEGKVVRSNDGYAKWAAKVAKSKGACFIDLNDLVAAKYEELGTDKVKTFFPADHTHTNGDGAKLNAEIVVQRLKADGPKKLKKYFK